MSDEDDLEDFETDQDDLEREDDEKETEEWEASSSPAFLMMYSAYKLNKQSDNIQP